MYRVLDIPNIHDGDTLWVVRERTVGEIEGAELIQRDYRGGTKVRLHDGGKGLQAAELKKAGGSAALQDLTDFVEGWQGDLELHTFGRDSFGRLLGDLVVIDHPNGYSAVQYMTERGHPTYKK